MPRMIRGGEYIVVADEAVAAHERIGWQLAPPTFEERLAAAEFGISTEIVASLGVIQGQINELSDTIDGLEAGGGGVDLSEITGRLDAIEEVLDGDGDDKGIVERVGDLEAAVSGLEAAGGVVTYVEPTIESLLAISNPKLGAIAYVANDDRPFFAVYTDDGWEQFITLEQEAE